MKCPKCELGEIKKILIKKENRAGFICEYCGSLWLEGEEINVTSGHSAQTLKDDNQLEYTFSENENEDPESKSIMYSKFK